MTKLFRIFVAMISLSLLSACGGGGGSPGNTTGRALFTSANSTVTINVGDSQTYTIGGGNPGYAATSSSSAATVTVNGSSMTITGKGAGEATITVTDSSGSKVQIVATIGTNAPFATDAPVDLTIAPGSKTNNYSLSGGSGVYRAASANPSVATVTLTGNQFYISGVSAGSTTISVSDTAGSSRTINVKVGSSTPLFTTAPSIMSIELGTTTQTFAIGGGSLSYAVSTNNQSVVTVSQSGANFTLTGLAIGNAIVSVTDTAGATQQIQVTVGVTQPLTVNSPAELTVGVGSASEQFTISGGSPAYSVTSSNLLVASIIQSGNRFTVSGKFPGTATVVVSDRSGATKSINVTVKTNPLFTSAPDAITVEVGARSASFSIEGGTFSYSVSTSNSAIAQVTQTATTFYISGINAGAAVVVVTDSAGSSKRIDVTVGAAVPLRTTMPTEVNMTVNQANDSFQISGGQPAYVVTSSNRNVVQVQQSGAQFTVTPIGVGKAQVQIMDAQGSTKISNVTVSTKDLFTSAPEAITLSTGSVSSSFTIGGGLPGYTVVSSNVQVAQVSFTGTSFTITGAGKGTASVVISDTGGSTKLVAVTVGSTIPLFTTAPSALDLPIGGSAVTFDISGGDPAYSVTSSNSQVATVSLAGNKFSVTGIAKGTAVLNLTDTSGQKVIINVNVTSGSDLYTTAPSNLSLGLGIDSNTYLIGGGSKSYSVMSGNTSVVTVVQNGNQFYLRAGTLGTTTVTITDTVGAVKVINVSVVNGLQLFTTAPVAMSVGVGLNSSTFQISGGVPSYFVISSNTGVVRVTQTGGQFFLTGQQSGRATVLITDSVGSSKSIDVTVTTGSDLYISAPATVAVGVGVSSQTYQVGGGSSIYSATSSNTQVATVSLTGSNFVITGVAVGTATVLVTDSTGASRPIIVTVGSAVDLFTTAPPTLNLGVNAISQSFSIGGGQAPYTVTTNDPAILTPTLTGTQFTIRGLAIGTADVIVSDSKGATRSVRVTVGSGVNLFTSAPSTISLAAGATSQVFTISGGSEVYVVSSSDERTVTIGRNSNNQFVVNGIVGGRATVSIKDTTGKEILISVIVGTPDVIVSSAPDTLTLQVGGAGTFKVAGGNGSYQVSTSNTTVAQATITGSDLVITGIGVGTANIVVTDLRGARLTIVVNIGGSTPTPLFTTAPSAVVITPSSVSNYSISGGKAPYTATSSNASVATVSVSGSSLTITGVALGAAQIRVTDSAGTIVNIDATVSNGSHLNLFTGAPEPSTVAKGSSLVYSIGGGVPPYTVTSSNNSVATVIMSGATAFQVTGVTSGTASVVIQDSEGVTITRTVNVTSATSLPVSILPGDSQGAVGDTMYFNVTGGSPPYTLTNNNNPTVATVSAPSAVNPLTGTSTFTADLLNIGSTTATIIDSQGQTKSVVISAVASVKQLRISPSVLTIGEDNSANFTVQIFGGTGPYRVFTSDLILSSVTNAGGISTVTVSPGTQGNRCFNRYDSTPAYIPGATYDITITAVDSLGVSATATMTLKDNSQGGAGSGAAACN
ncbi:pilus assembly protein N-terminal domain-containing protein [Undibacterium cyanobacteriorum]|uniref:Pilus assembly protein N-terminal domain-containing protein n=1 Tax=Undibacterium cyanobacteriorum TaxID=3073561 RepID=A0ABY9RJ35_9BURK|nr:pilus assembly protein N-terminal domain-containing protein [Undibacterium sp. 20NA77.5]WMW81247.1 pilus assembly protein N-terminal domain-containing protein [Undibacterium sp. 20NA77.5]